MEFVVGQIGAIDIPIVTDGEDPVAGLGIEAFGLYVWSGSGTLVYKRLEGAASPIVDDEETLTELAFVELGSGAYQVRLTFGPLAIGRFGRVTVLSSYGTMVDYPLVIGAAASSTAEVTPSAATTELAEAEADLALWKVALRAIATGQEYRIGTRQLVRADLKEVREMVAFYEGEVARLTSGRGKGARVLRVVPRDL